MSENDCIVQYSHTKNGGKLTLTETAYNRLLESKEIREILAGEHHHKIQCDSNEYKSNTYFFHRECLKGSCRFSDSGNGNLISKKKLRKVVVLQDQNDRWDNAFHS